MTGISWLQPVVLALGSSPWPVAGFLVGLGALLCLLLATYLPPEQVANNLAYLRAVTGQAGQARSWDAMRAGGGR